jgi:hypothetical protein
MILRTRSHPAPDTPETRRHRERWHRTAPAAFASLTVAALLALGLPTLASAEEAPVDPAVATSATTDDSGAALSAAPESSAAGETAEPSATPAEQPAGEPAAEEPPAEEPAAEPPAEEPPAAPVEPPPAESPPAEAPPAEQAPAPEAPTVEAPAAPPAEPAAGAPADEAARTAAKGGSDSHPKSALKLSKEVTSTQQKADDGTWDVEYEVTVQNPGWASRTTYDLTDTLERFGAGIVVNGAGWEGPGGRTGVWSGLPGDLETTLADDVQISAGTTHTYVIALNATLTQETLDEGSWQCSRHEKPGGFRNVAELRTGDRSEERVDASSSDAGYGGGYGGGHDRTQTATACSDPHAAKLTLIKHVDNTPLEGLPVEGADASDWTLVATSGDLRVEIVGSEDGGTVQVPTGTWTLSEEATPGQTNPLVPDSYEASAWTCEPTAADGDTVTLAKRDRVTCEITNTAIPDLDVGIVKTHELESETDTSVEPGDFFSWVLTVTNHGMPVENLEVTDLIDDQLAIVGPAVFDPEEGWQQTSGETDLAFSASFTGVFERDATATIRIPVIVVAPPPVDTPPVVGPDDPPPVLPPLDEDPLPNEACVAIVGEGDDVIEDDDPTNDCATDEIPVKRIDAGAYVRCVNDVPWLYYSIQTTDSVTPGPVTVTWTSGDGTLTKTETIPADALTGRLLWPGAAVDANGIPYQWPGWRPLTEQDLTDPPVPGDRFLDLILDEDVETYPWRDMVDPATIVFSINPSQAVLALYPMAMPSCEIERPVELVIDKTSSVTSAKPGTNFDYTLQVSSVGTGAAEPVTLIDEIPADLRVDGIATATEPTFPRWENCTVSGQNSSGYGGTLQCDLLGVLGPNLTTAPPVTLSVHLNERTTATSILNTGEVCWGEAPGDDEPGLIQCAEDPVTVTVPPRPATPAGGGTGSGLASSGFDGMPLLWAGGALLLVGGLALILGIRRRNGRTSD